MKNLYMADWHYGHKNIISYDNRPFKSIEEMDEALVANWNAAVSHGDKVYILGDMFWCTENAAIPILESLKGEKFLIMGNHDTCKKAAFRDQFSQIAGYLEVMDKDRHVVLSHYPIPCFKNHYHGWHHLYGHVHNSFEANMMEHDKSLLEDLYLKPCLMFNVGSMMPWMGYAPKTLDQILDGYAAWKAATQEIMQNNPKYKTKEQCHDRC